MTELRQKLLDIIASFAPPNVERSRFEEAKLLRDLPTDSIGMMGALDEIEEQLGIKYNDAVNPDLSVDEFEALTARLVAEKNA